MELVLAALPGVITTCLLVFVLLKALERQNEERQSHRIEVDQCRQEILELAKSHREEVAALNQARCEEVANLCQRIQAPEIAVGEHRAQSVGEDPEPYDLDDDLRLLSEREQALRELAEEISAE